METLISVIYFCGSHKFFTCFFVLIIMVGIGIYRGKLFNLDGGKK